MTRPIEQAAAQNSTIKPPSPSNFGIRSLSFPGLSVVYIQLDDNVKDKQKEFSDINLKLNQLQLPRGAGPIQFNSNFGDTAALMLTVASPIVTPTEVALRAIAIRKAIEAHARGTCPRMRRNRGSASSMPFRFRLRPGPVRSNFESIADIARRNGTLKDLHFFDGPGYVGLDASTTFDDETIRQRGEQLIKNNLHRSELYPDAWQPAIIRDPANTEAALPKSPVRNIPIASSTITPT